MKRWLALLVTLVVVLTACGGDDSDADGDASGLTSEVTDDDADEGVDFGSADGDEPSDTDEVAEDDAEPDESESTTSEVVEEDPRAEAEDEIRTVLETYDERWLECSSNPVDCDAEEAFADLIVQSEPLYARVVDRINDWRLTGQFIRVGEGQEGQDFERIESIKVDDDLQSAVAVLCNRDSRGAYVKSGEEFVLIEGTDFVSESRRSSALVLEDGLWKIVGDSLVNDGEGVCEES